MRKLLAPSVLLLGIAVFSAGPSLRTVEPSSNLHRVGFANRAASFSVTSGTWQLCDHANFTGQCITVGHGRYTASYDNGFAHKIVSLRPVTKPR
jgi:hypothetical protein